jgi:hypothetical protein
VDRERPANTITHQGSSRYRGRRPQPVIQLPRPEQNDR